MVICKLIVKIKIFDLIYLLIYYIFEFYHQTQHLLQIICKLD